MIQKSVQVKVPLRTAYNQWTQFEEFPEFMDGVEEVKQVNDTLTHWRTKIAGVEREFDAEIVSQQPDTMVAWKSVDGPMQAGTVSFRPLDSARTEVTLLMDFEPEGIVEKAGDTIGLVDRRVQGDLERFKDFIESRGTETGSWRGEV
ncbi:MAG: SRPBCC family protein [Longispora sp.]|nr:SRPBCC family protein [Longispora sp. (in: high G+C Gram-positive bacteria)]